MWFVVLVGALAALLVYLKFFVYRSWERKGFAVLPASSPLGCLGEVIRGKRSQGEVIRDIYLEHKEKPYLGLYFTFTPVLMVNDMALVKRILITDFDHFADRGVHYDEVNDPLTANLFTMPGSKWRELRAKLSPTFTSGKLKNMWPTIEQKSFLMREYLINLATEDVIQLKKATEQVNLSIIASVFFGLDLDAFAEPNHEFKQIGDIFFDLSSLRNQITNFGFSMCPTLLKTLKVSVMSPVVSKYVLNLVNSVMTARKEDPSLIRKDFIQTITELLENAKETDKFKLTMETCAAQAFLFYIAGYETSAATAAHCMYELSRSPVWMAKVREEVDQLMSKRNGTVLYEDVVGGDLKVLEACIKETMRMYPGVGVLNRVCIKKGGYEIPDTQQVIPEGTPIIVPVWGLQMDPQYYPEPERFDPSRFEGGQVGEDQPFLTVSRPFVEIL